VTYGRRIATTKTPATTVAKTIGNMSLIRRPERDHFLDERRPRGRSQNLTEAQQASRDAGDLIASNAAGSSVPTGTRCQVPNSP
jgi:hypothetical protein